ncbi:MAG: SagB/ThcOx family dehydrogenase [Candidatus Aminicenantes bacterium]
MNHQEKSDSMAKGRDFLRSNRRRDRFGGLSDQMKGMEFPPIQKDYPKDADLIDLIPPEEFNLGKASLLDVINQRRSHRRFTDQAFSLEELSYLLWTTQGVKRVLQDGYVSLRTVPSAGARHAFETYVVVKNTQEVNPGLYRYLAVEHKLLPLTLDDPDLFNKTAAACCDQPFVAMAAASFIWTAIPYRCEWRYSVLSHKVLAIDVGHVCQNLYLAAEAVGAGVCAIAAYFQDEMDELIGVDGEDEFVIYVAPAGKVPSP